MIPKTETNNVDKYLLQHNIWTTPLTSTHSTPTSDLFHTLFLSSKGICEADASVQVPGEDVRGGDEEGAGLPEGVRPSAEDQAG